jgi:hypothetical protein
MQRCAADAPLLAATSSLLLHAIRPILEALLAHYDSCEYVLVSFHDDNSAHIPCVVSRAGGEFAAVTPHHRGLSFCMTTLQRPIPVIISPIIHSARFSKHPLVVGPPYLTVPHLVRRGAADPRGRVHRSPLYVLDGRRRLRERHTGIRGCRGRRDKGERPSGRTPK